MRAGWNGAAPPDLPPPGALDRLRLVLRGAAAVLLTTLCFAVFLAARGIDKLLRALSRRGTPALAPWIVHVWARLALPLVGLRLRRRGVPMAHPGAIVANHASWLDILVLQSAVPVFFVAKSEVSAWPVIGFIGRAIGTLFIERRATQARIQSEALHRRLRRGDLLCIFPEGTSSDGQRVLPFKSSLFGVFFEPDLRDLLRVQPVSIRYRPRPGLPAAFYGWWGEMEFGGHLMQVLARSTGGVVEIVFHPPLRVAEQAGRKQLAANAQTAVKEVFQGDALLASSDP